MLSDAAIAEGPLWGHTQWAAQVFGVGAMEQGAHRSYKAEYGAHCPGKCHTPSARKRPQYISALNITTDMY